MAVYAGQCCSSNVYSNFLHQLQDIYNTMIIMREKLAALMFKQSWNDVIEASSEQFENLPASIKDRYLEQADKIIDFFVEAIKNQEFEYTKHYHEKINSAFVFPPCKSYEVKT